jgi:hypothetical protein
MNFVRNEKSKQGKSRELRVIIFDIFGIAKSEILFGKIDIYKLNKKFPKEKIYYIQFSAYFMLEAFYGVVRLFNFHIKYSINMDIIHHRKKFFFNSNMHDEFIISLNK